MMSFSMRGSCKALIMAAAVSDLGAHGFIATPSPRHRISLTSSRSLLLARASTSRNAVGMAKRRQHAIVAVHGLEDIASIAPDLLLAHGANAAQEGHAKAVELMENPVARALLNTPSGWSLILLSALLFIGQVIHTTPFSPRIPKERLHTNDAIPTQTLADECIVPASCHHSTAARAPSPVPFCRAGHLLKP